MSSVRHTSDEGYKTVKIGPKEFTVPESWELRRIPEICDLSTESFDPEEHDGDTFEYIDIESVSPGKIEGSKTIKVEEAPSRAKQIVDEGDTLIGKVRPYLRAFAPVTDEYDGFVCSTGFAVLSAEEGVDAGYLTQATLSKYFLDQMTNRMTGTSYPAVNKSDFENVQIFVPPLVEQRRIADVLSATDEQIRQSEKSIENDSELRQGIIDDLYRLGYRNHKKMVSPNELTERSGGVNTGLDQTTVGTIPADWEVARLGELSKTSSYGLNASAEEYDENAYRYLRITDIADDGHLKQDDLTSVSREKGEDFVLKPGDLVFARTGATVGKSFLCREEHPEMAYAGYLIKFQLDTSRVLPEFVFYYTQTENYRRWVTRITRQGAQENINTGEYSSILLPLPSVEEQQEIVNVIETVKDRVQEERETMQTLQELKRGLMQDLLTGKRRLKKNS